MKWVKHHIEPDGHEEGYISSGEILTFKNKEINLCKHGEWTHAHGKDIRFNDVFVTYIGKNGETKYIELNGWHLEIYPDEKPKKKGQISIFDLLEV